MELPPLKNKKHNSESASTIDQGLSCLVRYRHLVFVTSFGLAWSTSQLSRVVQKLVY